MPRQLKATRKATTLPEKINVPDAVSGDRLPLREVPAEDALAKAMVNAENSYLRSYVLGECRVLVTKERGLWHLSISHRHRDPSWAEISQARYRLLPDGATMAMLLPPKAEYVNVHRFCFHLYEIESEGTHHAP